MNFSLHLKIKFIKVSVELGKPESADSSSHGETLIRSNHQGNFTPSGSWFGFRRQTEL